MSQGTRTPRSRLDSTIVTGAQDGDTITFTDTIMLSAATLPADAAGR